MRTTWNRRASEAVYVGMALIPLVDLDYVCALLGVDRLDPADDDDVELLRGLLERRLQAPIVSDITEPPPGRPRLRLVK
jgi:hypothetical protein